LPACVIAKRNCAVGSSRFNKASISNAFCTENPANLSSRVPPDFYIRRRLTRCILYFSQTKHWTVNASSVAIFESRFLPCRCQSAASFAASCRPKTLAWAKRALRGSLRQNSRTDFAPSAHADPLGAYAVLGSNVAFDIATFSDAKMTTVLHSLDRIHLIDFSQFLLSRLPCRNMNNSAPSHAI